jgi:hypothetical protein
MTLVLPLLLAAAATAATADHAAAAAPPVRKPPMGWSSVRTLMRYRLSNNFRPCLVVSQPPPPLPLPA